MNPKKTFENVPEKQLLRVMFFDWIVFVRWVETNSRRSHKAMMTRRAKPLEFDWNIVAEDKNIKSFPTPQTTDQYTVCGRGNLMSWLGSKAHHVIRTTALLFIWPFPKSFLWVPHTCSRKMVLLLRHKETGKLLKGTSKESHRPRSGVWLTGPSQLPWSTRRRGGGGWVESQSGAPAVHQEKT